MASGSEQYASYNRGVKLGYITPSRRRRGIQRVVTDTALQELVGF
jgi:hypothetical protein